MKDFTPLCFPETNPDISLRLQLLTAFDRLLFYRPPTGREIDAQKDPLEAQGLSRGYVPIPLDPEAARRFQQLLKEITGHGNEFYGGYLSSLSARVGSHHDEEVWSLIADLSRGDAREAGKKAEQEVVWQAMLLLQLAEQYRTAEQGLANGLSAIEKKQTDLFETLKGEKEFSRHLEPANVTSRTTMDYNRLTRAWAHLFIRDTSAASPWIVVTARKEAADLALDTYEQVTGQRPQLLPPLALPNLEKVSEAEALSRLQAYREGTGKFRAEIGRLLWDMAIDRETDNVEKRRSDLEKLTAAWEKQETAGLGRDRRFLQFYRLAGMPLPDLFGRLGHEQGRPPAPGPVAHGILAVVS